MVYQVILNVETKRLIVEPLREERMLGVFRAADALAEAISEGRQIKRMALRSAQLQQKSKAKM